MENKTNVIQFKNDVVGSNALKTDRRIKEKLGFRDIWEINKKKRATEKLRNTYKADMEYRQLESEIRINDLTAKQNELEQECQELNFKIKNMTLNNALAQEERKHDYYTITNKNKKSSIKNDEIKGDNLQKISLGLSYGSCATSIFGIVIGFLSTIFEIIATRKVNVNGFISIFIVCCSLYCFLKLAKNNNKVLETIPHQIHKFFDKKNKESVFTLTIDIIFVFANVILSIFTNYLFWRTTGLIVIGQIIFSFALDFGAIACTFTAYQFKELRYSEKYKNEILESDPNQEILEKINRKQKEKQEQNIEEKDIKNEQKNEEKDIKNEQKNEEKDIKNEQKNEENKLSENFTANNFKTVLENKKIYKKAGRKNITKAKINKLQKAINVLENNTIITPKKVGFEDEKNVYYELIQDMKNVENYTNEKGQIKYKKVGAKNE